MRNESNVAHESCNGVDVSAGPWPMRSIVTDFDIVSCAAFRRSMANHAVIGS